MPRFFFHVRGAYQELSRDELGLDLPDVETARFMTFCAARDMLSAFVACGWDPRDYTIEVANAADEMVFSLTFSKAFGHRAAGLPRLFRQ